MNSTTEGPRWVGESTDVDRKEYDALVARYEAASQDVRGCESSIELRWIR